MKFHLLLISASDRGESSASRSDGLNPGAASAANEVCPKDAEQRSCSELESNPGRLTQLSCKFGMSTLAWNMRCVMNDVLEWSWPAFTNQFNCPLLRINLGNPSSNSGEEVRQV
jgi:hypothetical protein